MNTSVADWYPSLRATRRPAAFSGHTRVLFVHNHYQQRGGEDTVVEAEIELLRKRGHPVELYSRSNFDLEEMSRLDAGLQTLWSTRSMREMEALITGFAPDVIHVHNSFPLISPSVHWAAARAGIPSLQTLHNFRLLCPQALLLRDGKACEDCVGRIPWRGALRRCYRGSASQSAAVAGLLTLHRLLGTWRDKVTRFVALSRFSRDKYIAGGLPADRIIVSPNFADVPPPDARQPRDGLLFVGRISEEKGVGLLAEAMRRLPDTKLRVVGDGPLAHLLVGLGNVSMLGRLDRDSVYREMRCAQALVLPSTCYENCPMAVIEAQGCGLPVIGSAIGGIPELLEDGITGWLFEAGCVDGLARTIEHACSDPGVLAGASRAARRCYEQGFTPEIAYAARRRLYEFADLRRADPLPG